MIMRRRTCLTRSFDATIAFYSKLGFVTVFKDDGWLVLKRGSIALGFFPHPNPKKSWFCCCLHLDAVDAFFDVCTVAEIPEATTGQPRIHAPTYHGDMKIGALIDPDGSLIRVMNN